MLVCFGYVYVVVAVFACCCCLLLFFVVFVVVFWYFLLFFCFFGCGRAYFVPLSRLIRPSLPPFTRLLAYVYVLCCSLFVCVLFDFV